MINDQQRRFAGEYLTDFNATEAAIRAGYTENRRSAATIGSRLLKNSEIRGIINDQMEAVIRSGVADAAEVGHFLTATMRDPSAPWAARMMAANSLLKRLMDEPVKDTPVILDDIPEE